METVATDLVQKVPTNYCCILCDYNTSRVSQYERHLTTAKHVNRQKTTFFNSLELKVPDQLSGHSCNKYVCNNCAREYKDRSGLWKHNKTCIVVTDIDKNEEIVVDESQKKDKVIELLIKENTDFKNIILEFMKNSSDMQKQLIDVCKNSNSTIISHNNSHNKTFNLQLFLNETCKNAMNLSDFVKSVNVQISDLEKMGELGYVEGISDIIIKNLKDLEIDKRPLHCTDAKREIMYVKDENKWEREEKEKKKLRSAINQVATKNMKLLLDYKDKHPDCVDPDSDESVKFNQMLIEVLGGSENDNEEKVLKKLSKEVVLDKCNDII